MGRKRRTDRPRTKSGHLSRAYRGVARDNGTHEFCAKRAYLINGSDPQLAGSASGILLANAMITRKQHDAAMRYARWHALLYGTAWNVRCTLGAELASHGSEPPEHLHLRAKTEIDAANARLDHNQRRAIGNVCIFGFIPAWFVAERQNLRALPEDAREREALESGLEVLVAWIDAPAA